MKAKFEFGQRVKVKNGVAEGPFQQDSMLKEGKVRKIKPSCESYYYEIVDDNGKYGDFKEEHLEAA